MQKKNKEKRINLENVWNNYHGGSFDKLLVFTSDRKLKASDNREKFDKMKKIGLEIETASTMITSNYALARLMKEYVFNKLDDDFFKYEYDGSLRGSSTIECITQCFTKEFIRNNYYVLKHAYEKMGDIGVKPNDSCGMHINLSNSWFGSDEKEQIDNLKKLFWLINQSNESFSFWASMFKRSVSCTRYCGRMQSWEKSENGSWVTIRANTIENVKNLTIDDFPSDHTYCLNYSHFASGRIEIRLVGGQQTFGAFKNTLEVIFHIIPKLKEMTWKDIESNNLKKLFSGCNQHVLSRLKDVYSSGNQTYQAIESNYIYDSKVEVR